MNFWRSAEGMLEMEVTSADCESAFAAFGAADIELFNLKRYSELTVSFQIKRENRALLEEICKKRGENIRARKKLGIYWFVRKGLKRPVLLFGGAALLALVCWLPTRVLFVSVEGNLHLPERKILAAAEECGIRFGSSRRAVRSEKMKNALLAAVPELQWAGVNTNGCRAVISVREKCSGEQEKPAKTAASVTAVRDGYVLYCNAVKGNLQVGPGDTVREGQVLISAYTDCGFCIRAERAEGEILAQTNREIRAVAPLQRVRKGNIQEEKRKISLLIRKKRFFLWKDSGIREGSCDRMYEEYYITLPGGFQLPFALCVERYIFRDSIQSQIPEEEAGAELERFAEKYLSRQMVGGSIVRKKQTVANENGLLTLTGNYVCVEMIGKVRQEQIGDTNGQND